LLLLAFGAIAGGLLASMLLLEGRLRAVRLELERTQTEIAGLQAAVSAGRDEGATEGQVAAAVRNSAVVGMAFDVLREATPADLWIASAQIEPGGLTKFEGVSLSYGSPFAFASALSAWPEFAELGMPELRQETLKQRRVYRFTLTARVQTPQASTQAEARP
jgi:hypothetical protein